MSCKYTLGNIRGPHGLSILRGGEGEFDGEFDGNSREFDDGFGEFDVFQYACGAMNPSTGARRGRGKVSFYKIKRRNRLAPAPGPGVWFLLRATLARGL